MMPPNSYHYGFQSGIFLLHLHWIFSGLAVVGFLLFTYWAIKHLEAKSLKTLSIWMLAVGCAGVLLTATPAMTGFKDMMRTWKSDDNFCGHSMNMNLMDTMMERMEEHSLEQREGDHEEMMRTLEKVQGPWHDRDGTMRMMNQ